MYDVIYLGFIVLPNPAIFAYLGNIIQSYDTNYHRSVALSKTIQQTYYS